MSVVLSSFRARLEATERELVVEALAVTDGGICAAARMCGMHPFQMRRIVQRHQLQALLKPASRARPPEQFGNAAWRALGDV
jgi:transcriptional regulator with GAF, ATPase, and Fis domain